MQSLTQALARRYTDIDATLSSNNADGRATEGSLKKKIFALFDDIGDRPQFDAGPTKYHERPGEESSARHFSWIQNASSSFQELINDVLRSFGDVYR